VPPLDNQPPLRINFFPCSLILLPRNSDLDFCWSPEIGIIRLSGSPGRSILVQHAAAVPYWTFLFRLNSSILRQLSPFSNLKLLQILPRNMTVCLIPAYA